MIELHPAFADYPDANYVYDLLPSADHADMAEWLMEHSRTGEIDSEDEYVFFATEADSLPFILAFSEDLRPRVVRPGWSADRDENLPIFEPPVDIVWQRRDEWIASLEARA